MFDGLSDKLKGYQDAWNGVPHEEGKGEDYDWGYRMGYQEQQVLTWKTDRGK